MPMSTGVLWSCCSQTKRGKKRRLAWAVPQLRHRTMARCSSNWRPTKEAPFGWRWVGGLGNCTRVKGGSRASPGSCDLQRVGAAIHVYSLGPQMLRACNLQPCGPKVFKASLHWGLAISAFCALCHSQPLTLGQPVRVCNEASKALQAAQCTPGQPHPSLS
ncbi:hypothetical protein M011DRAFT_312724 [Sporormia fimetaria CBS 119925]|uniref:Uncharacterized protein n=1 Tax=Sporormia fimetaria CBS 119925 TaxID=1340428 RepID=A0A6A6VHI7_9PLEO|nr:hypothetical protein M011DRAFT_312724 [Sporormia fimetaria CBS 119925]